MACNHKEQFEQGHDMQMGFPLFVYFDCLVPLIHFCRSTEYEGIDHRSFSLTSEGEHLTLIVKSLNKV